jgi:polysaccharide export outer membrane protein
MRNYLFSKWKGGIGYVIAIAFAGCISSCGNTRQLTYMQGKFDTAALSKVEVAEPVIQKGDVLSIIVYSDNPTATALYNQSVMATSGSGSSQSIGAMGGGGLSSGTGGGGSSPGGSAPSTPGYLVDEQGNIQFQSLKFLHVEGLTKQQLRDSLDARLDERFGGPLKNPYYTIRFVNYRFTMLGEVNRPGVFNIPGEHINLFEALGMAGDMTFYGRRDNVLVMRVSNGKREFQRLDLTKPEIMVSPYYYLQQGDVVYFEPNKKRVAASDQVTIRNVSIATSIVSTLAVLYSIFRK